MDIADETVILVEKARSGCELAFTELVRLHHHVLRSFLRRFMRQDPAVDDLAQQVLLKAYRELEQLRDEMRFTSWLLGIARNEALAYLRKEARRRRREQHVAEAALTELQVHRLEEVAAAEHGETLSDLRACLENLPGTSRKVIEKYYFQNCSSQTIATEMQKNSGSIRMMLWRIRRVLAKCVKQKQNRREDG